MSYLTLQKALENLRSAAEGQKLETFNKPNLLRCLCQHWPEMRQSGCPCDVFLSMLNCTVVDV